MLIRLSTTEVSAAGSAGAAFTANVPSELTHITAVIAEAIKRLSVFFFISFLSFHKINIKDVENKNDAGELLRYKVMGPLTLAS